jgi:hypothetical protein
MQDVIQFSWNVYEFAYIVVVEFKLLEFEQVFDVLKITGNQVVHCNNMTTFPDESIAKVRA